MTKFTYALEADEEDGIGQSDEGVFRQLSKFTYSLEMDEEDRIGWSNEGYSDN